MHELTHYILNHCAICLQVFHVAERRVARTGGTQHGGHESTRVSNTIILPLRTELCIKLLLASQI